MRKPGHITLVLMGGGMILGLSGCGDNCAAARAEKRVDADQICRSTSRSTGSGIFGWGSLARRGGFGGTAHASSSGG